MSPLPLPHRRISPETLYLSYLPDLYRAVVAGLSLPPAQYSIQVVISDEAAEPDGFVLNFADQSLSAQHGFEAAPLATFTFDRQAFRVGARDLLPRALVALESQLQNLRQHVADAFVDVNVDAYLGRIARLSGSITLHHEDETGVPITTQIRVGDGAGPQAAVSTNHDDFLNVINGKISLPQIVRGRSRLGANAGYVLRLLRALDPRAGD